MSFIEKVVRSHWKMHGETYTIKCTFWKDGSGGRVKIRYQENGTSHKTLGAYCRTSAHADIDDSRRVGMIFSMKRRILTHGKENVLWTLFCVAALNYYVLVMCIFTWEFHKHVQCIWIISTLHSLSNRKIWRIIYKRKI